MVKSFRLLNKLDVLNGKFVYTPQKAIISNVKIVYNPQNLEVLLESSTRLGSEFYSSNFPQIFPDFYYSGSKV